MSHEETPLLEAITDLANHWRYPSGDFRYGLSELAQTIRETVYLATGGAKAGGVDVFAASEWKPRDPEANDKHEVAFQQRITDANTQTVCTCGHVFDSYGATVAERFGQHLRRVRETKVPT